MSPEDVRHSKVFTRWLKKSYPGLNIVAPKPINLIKKLKIIELHVDDIIKAAKTVKVQSGSLATRLYALYTLEFGEKTNSVVIDTTNGTEYIIGELVFGIGGQISPLVTLFKSQVYDLAELLSIPNSIIDRPAIDSTWGNSKIESYFPQAHQELTPRMAYAVIDPILHLIFNEHCQPKEISKKLGHGLPFIERVYEKVKLAEPNRATAYLAMLKLLEAKWWGVSIGD